MSFQIYNGSTAISDEINFKDVSTSNTDYTLEATTLPSVSDLSSNLLLRCTLGYYGGALNGATCFVEYTTSSSSGYTYTYTIDSVSEDHTIIVTYGDSVRYTISCTSIDSSLTTDKTFPYTVIEGGSTDIVITPSTPGTLTVNDNGVETQFSIPASSISAQTYTISNVQEDHVLIISFEEITYVFVKIGGV